MSEHEEYTAENYPSFGKKYKGEKAVISLTSWTARIKTVAKTLYSLVKMCPGFHIVLVLAEEEFPKMTSELPENLMLFVDNELIELMFVRKNYKSFKKVLFTMDKYRDVPVISADDDCFYTCNYAKELYDKWYVEKDNVYTYYTNSNWNGPIGPCTLYPPFLFSKFNEMDKKDIENYLYNDDSFFKKFLNRNNIKIIGLYNYYPFKFHTKIGALNPGQYTENQFRDCL